MKRRIFLVEDDHIFLRPLQRSLEVAGYDVLVAPSGEDAIDLLKHEDADLVLTDKRLPGMDGVELVRRVKAEHADLAMVIMTAYGTIESAVESVRLGAADYLVKPFEVAELLIVVRNAIELSELRAASRATLRRNQERFTLKNVLARSAAIPAELFESELFGFRRGAFTSASETRRGHLQMANGGTLLLDEIGEMPLPLQSKLLRVIEDRRVTPIGSDRAVEVDVRFIATTNKDLPAEVERGAFRRDLYYQLSVMPIRVPPLRERTEDIPLLAQHFLEARAPRPAEGGRPLDPRR